jgi:hypothetical protein
VEISVGIPKAIIVLPENLYSYSSALVLQVEELHVSNFSGVITHGI